MSCRRLEYMSIFCDIHCKNSNWLGFPDNVYWMGNIVYCLLIAKERRLTLQLKREKIVTFLTFSTTAKTRLHVILAYNA